MGFFWGLIFGAAASSYYWNKESWDREFEKKKWMCKQNWRESQGPDGEKSYQLESEDYKVLINLIQKNTPKPTIEEPKRK